MLRVLATHFIERISDTNNSTRRLLSFLWRLYFVIVTAGSFSKTIRCWRRFGIENSNRWIYYKNDDLDDPFINDEHVKFLDIANDEQIAYIKEETRHINELL